MVATVVAPISGTQLLQSQSLDSCVQDAQQTRLAHLVKYTHEASAKEATWQAEANKRESKLRDEVFAFENKLHEESQARGWIGAPPSTS
jgi:hypothetical protein